MSRILINGGAVLAERVLPAETSAERMRGLLGRSSLPPGDGMLFRPGGGIHTWFMRFAIDVAFLDREMRVLKIVRRMRPWRAAFAPRATRAVLETAADGMRAVAVGDRLMLD